MQLTRGESIADTGRVLSRYVHAIAIRSGSHDAVVELAEASEVPVINALTPEHHPCQALADILTLRERFGSLEGLRVAYVGDGNNVARSLAILGGTAGIELVVAAPEGYRLEDELGSSRPMIPPRPPRAPTPSTPTSGSRWATRRRRRSAAKTSPLSS